MPGYNRSVKRANNISTSFRPEPFDAAVAEELLDLTTVKKTPEKCLPAFDRYAWQLTDYSFWYLLSTIWVSYSGFSDLNLWIKHFGSDRPGREKSIMKPNELKAYKKLPPMVKAYRAHRKGETKFISYTTRLAAAKRFARACGVDEVVEYRVPKEKILAYFLRREEYELIVVDHSGCTRVGEIKLG